MNALVTWFAKNTVAANLLMALIMVGGLLNLSSIRMEVFPEFSSDRISISVPYLGAAPEEVEEAICARIEERLVDLESVKKITSTAAEGAGTVMVELLPNADVRQALDDVKARIDAIDTFPEEAEQPIVQELIQRRQVLNVAISGDTDERTLKLLGEQVRDEISQLDGITLTELVAARPYEISIEISELDLQRHGLTFDEVAQAVRRSSLDLPGGSVRSRGGEILLRTQGQAYRGEDFERLVLINRPDGTRLTLSEVATVVDGFAETDQAARFDNRPAVLVQVFRVGEQDSTEVSATVRDYIVAAQARMPEGIELTIWQDDNKVLESRLETLIRNGRTGLILVLLVLALFLRLRLAGWVALGIPISFLGAFWLMPPLDLSINVISLFALIAVLGIVVDDAIIVGENIYRHHQEGKVGLEAAVAGVREVAVPVLFSVLTTMAAFAPLTQIPGSMGKVFRVIPIVIITTLFFSLIESLLVLPAHLSHLKAAAERRQAGKIRGAWQRFQRRFSDLQERFIEEIYGPLVERAIERRYLTLALATSLLLLTFGMVGSGRVQFNFFPPVEADNVAAILTMPQGTPVEVTSEALARLERGALELRREVEQSGDHNTFAHILVTAGEQPFRSVQSQSGARVGTHYAGGHLGEVNIELGPAEAREITAAQIAARWRELTGPIPDAVELTFSSAIFSSGAPILVRLAGPDLSDLRAAAAGMKQQLRSYPGVFDIADSFRAGKQEAKLRITPEAETLGLTLSDLARQVRQAFFGEEAQRIQRGSEEIKVMVRYPAAERRSLANLEQMKIRTPAGGEVPFSVAGELDTGRGFASISRTDRNRTVDVTADLDLAVANANQILADLEVGFLPELLAQHRGLQYTLEGERQEQRDTMGGLLRGFVLALFMIYALLAVPFKSYVQPLIVMTAIPFGLMGAIWGHMIIGISLTMLSGIGMVALTGVVVNDSLVMVDFVNRAYRGGSPLAIAIRDAGKKRFRPIVLTSLTTFVGLAPLLLEKSVQAQFLIPMAASIAFGVLFVTGIVLVLVPVTYYILEDLKAGWRRWVDGPRAEVLLEG